MKLKIIIVLILGAILAGIYSFFPDDTRKAQDMGLSPQTAQMASGAANAEAPVNSRQTEKAQTSGREIVEEEIKPVATFKHEQTPAPEAALPDAEEKPQAVAPASESSDGSQEPSVETASTDAQASVKTEDDSSAAQPASEIFPQKPDQSQIRELQQYLANLGYPVGAIDGLLGPKTYGAIMEFQSELGITAIIPIPKLIPLLETYQKVSTHYTGWKRIYQSQEFKNWIASKAAPVSQAYVKALRNGPEEEIISIINQYFQET